MKSVAMRVGCEPSCLCICFNAQGNIWHANELEEVPSSAMQVYLPPMRPPCLYGLCLLHTHA